MQEDPLGGCSVTQGRNDSGSTDQGGHSDDSEKSPDSGYILKLSQMWGVREREVKGDSKIHGKDGVAIYWDLEDS